MYGVWNFFAKAVDLSSKRIKSAEAIIKQGDWRFIGLSNYTVVNPLVVLQNVKTKIVYQPQDIGYFEGVGLTINYDHISQKFVNLTARDVYQVEVRFKVKPSLQDGHIDLTVESPTFDFNPVNANSATFVKEANEEHFISQQFMIFIGEDVLENGIEFFITPRRTNVSIYDVSYFITRVASGK